MPRINSACVPRMKAFFSGKQTAQMNSERVRIADQLRRAFNGDARHVARRAA